MNYKKLLQKFNPLTFLAYVMAVSLFLASCMFAYITLVPVDVLQDWEIKTDQETYTTGQTLAATSTFKKVRQSTGIAKRYITCPNMNGSDVRLPIGESTADRKADNIAAKNTLYLALPADIPNLPAKCRLEISVEYTIYSFRSFTETAQSNEFTVTQKTDAAPVTQVPVTADTDNQVVEDAPQNNPRVQVRNAPQGQVNSVQLMPLERPSAEIQEEAPVTQPPSRNLLQKTVDSILGVL